MTKEQEKRLEALEDMQKQNNKLLNIIADMLSLTPPMGSAKVCYAYLEPYYKLRNMPLEPLEKLAEDLEELHEKQLYEKEFQFDYELRGG